MKGCREIKDPSAGRRQVPHAGPTVADGSDTNASSSGAPGKLSRQPFLESQRDPRNWEHLLRGCMKVRHPVLLCVLCVLCGLILTGCNFGHNPDLPFFFPR